MFSKFNLLAIILAAASVLVVSGCNHTYSDSDPILDKPVDELSEADMAKLVADVSTNYGNFKIGIRPDWSPKTARNFVKLVKEGFYDGLTFHEIRPNLWIVGGCPIGDGTGGPGYNVPLEASAGKNEKGAVGLFHPLESPDQGGSQFYIMLTSMPAMNGVYAAFGQVIEGMPTVERIGGLAVTPSDGKPRPYMPLTPVVIKDIRLLVKTK